MLCVLFLCVLCEKKYVIPYLSLCHSVLQKSSVSLRHSVILSSKKHLSPFVIMSFCLTKITSFSPSLCYSVFKKNICLSPSLCYSVFKKNICLPLSLCHYVFKKHLSPSVTLLFCLQKKHLSLSVTMLFCLKTPQLGMEAGPAVVVVISFLSVLYQYFISCATSSPTTFLQYILFDKVVEITSCGILRTVSYLVPLRGSKLPFKTIEEHVEYLSLSVV